MGLSSLLVPGFITQLAYAGRGFDCQALKLPHPVLATKSRQKGLGFRVTGKASPQGHAKPLQALAIS